MNIALVSRTVFNAPLWVAEAQGYFDQAGIRIDSHVYNDADAISEALLSGQADLAITTPEGALLNANREGTLRIIGANAERPPHFLITRSGISEIAQLKGGRIGVLSKTEGTSYLFVKLATDNGLSREDFELVEVGGAPTRAGLLAKGEIDAGLQPFPLSYEAEATGLRNLGPVSDYVPHYLFTSINVNADNVSNRRELFEKFFCALSRGLAFIEQNPDRAAKDIAGPLNTTPAIARRVIDDALRLEIFAKSMQFNKDSLQAVVDGLVFSGQISRPADIDLEKALDRSFVASLPRSCTGAGGDPAPSG